MAVVGLNPKQKKALTKSINKKEPKKELTGIQTVKKEISNLRAEIRTLKKQLKELRKEFDTYKFNQVFGKDHI